MTTYACCGAFYKKRLAEAKLESVGIGESYDKYDAIALICSNKWNLCKFKYMRICTDLLCLFTGTAMFLLSGHSIRQIGSLMGIGTVLTAFCMGPLIDFFDRKVSKPFLAKGKIEKCNISE